MRLIFNCSIFSCKENYRLSDSQSICEVSHLKVFILNLSYGAHLNNNIRAEPVIDLQKQERKALLLSSFADGGSEGKKMYDTKMHQVSS